MLKYLSPEVLYDVMVAYDRYIQAACEDRRFSEDWYPVCISEFYDCEYQDVWLNRKDDNCFLDDDVEEDWR